MPFSEPKSRLVWVRDRKSGETDIRRVTGRRNHFSASEYTPDPRIHYVDQFRNQVCRCSNMRQHHGAFQVASDSTHDVFRITRFLDHHKRNSCSMAEIYVYEEEQRGRWARSGVEVGDFHYVTRDKDLVCRCIESHHDGCDMVRNPEIMELCVGFFCIRKEEILCSKGDWRDYRDGLIKSSIARSEPLNCNSAPAQKIMSNDAHQISDLLPSQLESKMKRLSNGPRTKLDVPREVWQKARPAAWKDCHATVSSVSTPLGTVHSLPSPIKEAEGVWMSRPQSLDLPNRTSTDTCWTEIQRDATRHGPKALNNSSTTASVLDYYEAHFGSEARSNNVKDGQAGNSSPNGNSPKNYCNDSPSMSLRKTRPQKLSPAYDGVVNSNTPHLTPDLKAPGTPTAELPTGKPPAELEASTLRVHSATLRELEGYQSEHPVEISGKSTSPRSSVAVEQSNSQTAQVPTRLSSRFRAEYEAGPLPSQEDLLLREVIPCSRTFPAEAGVCALCNESYDDRRKQTVYIPNCKHFIHEQCLVGDFRYQDQNIGTCPLCRVALCERGLANLIDTDRRAIFGPQYTRLPEEVRVEYPHRDEAARLHSSEEVAAAQLRLLKDYIDIHAEDALRQ